MCLVCVRVVTECWCWYGGGGLEHQRLSAALFLHYSPALSLQLGPAHAALVFCFVYVLHRRTNTENAEHVTDLSSLEPPCLLLRIFQLDQGLK